MFKFSYYITFILLPVFHYTQVGINTEKTNEASIFHVNSNDKGVLIPKVQLISLTDQAPLVGTITESTMVFNTNTANTGINKVFPGFYYWKNSQWNTLTLNTSKTQYQVVQFKNDPKSYQDFNGTAMAPGKEIDIFSTEVFNDNNTIYNKLSNTTLQLNEDGVYLATLNLALIDLTSNKKIYGVNSNVEIYMGFTLSDISGEKFVAEKILTMVPQFRNTGSELISDLTLPTVTQLSTIATRQLFTRGKFSFTLSTYINAKAGQVLRLRALQNNTSLRANDWVLYDNESISTLTIVKLK